MTIFDVVGCAWHVKTNPSATSLSVKMLFWRMVALPSFILAKQLLQIPPWQEYGASKSWSKAASKTDCCCYMVNVFSSSSTITVIDVVPSEISSTSSTGIADVVENNSKNTLLSSILFSANTSFTVLIIPSGPQR